MRLAVGCSRFNKDLVDVAPPPQVEICCSVCDRLITDGKWSCICRQAHVILMLLASVAGCVGLVVFVLIL